MWCCKNKKCFVVFAVIFLMMGQTDMDNFLILAHKEDMVNGEYVFVSIDTDAGKSKGKNSDADVSPPPTIPKELFGDFFLQMRKRRVQQTKQYWQKRIKDLSRAMFESRLETSGISSLKKLLKNSRLLTVRPQLFL